MAKSKLSSVDKLKHVSAERFETRSWYAKMSCKCQTFVLEACSLYVANEIAVPSITQLRVVICELIAEDFPEDAEYIPADRTFRTWFHQQKSSGMLSKEKTPSQPVSTKKQAVSKRRTV